MIEKILTDDYILNLYKSIEEIESKNGAPAYHAKKHAINVSKMCEKILSDLNYSSEMIEASKIAGLLHDLGCSLGREKHEIYSYNIAKKYLKNIQIDLKYKKLILDAIRNHRNNFTSDNIITRVLILADKLDITKTRVAPNGYNLIGMRQYQYVNNVKVSIRDGILMVKFEVDPDIDMSELLNFYFTKKIFKSIESFSYFENLKYCIYINKKVIERSD